MAKSWLSTSSLVNHEIDSVLQTPNNALNPIAYSSVSSSLRFRRLASRHSVDWPLLDIVQKLEQKQGQRHKMRPDEIAKSYDQIADVWDSEEFPRTNGVKQHERAIAFLQQKQYALDIGCGCNSRIIDLLESYGFSVEGIDISDRMIELAKLRHPNVTFHHGDICSWPFPRKYDFISAWDSIWHLPLTEHASVLKRILQALKPGGICIFTAGGLDAPLKK